MPTQFQVTGIWENDEYMSDFDRVFNKLVGDTLLIGVKTSEIP